MALPPFSTQENCGGKRDLQQQWDLIFFFFCP
uniref:Uncharacterized protein n=1 Tax=Rhizophora mucronata TaxID=61149 RepID=A0A2P2QXK3_RHIMU